MKRSIFHKSFVRIQRGPSIWHLGYNTKMRKYIAWSPTVGPGKFKELDSIDDLRNLLRWHLNKDYGIVQINVENIEEFATNSQQNTSDP